jgi:hypothetical protein
MTRPTVLSTIINVATVLMVVVMTVVVHANADDVECRLYLAPSYLTREGKVAVFGLFAGPSGFQKDEIIPSHEITVPVFDFLNTPVRQRSDLHSRVLDFIESSCWIADYAGSKYEGNNSISAFIPGIGSLTNYHAGLANVDWDQASILLREPDDVVRDQIGKPHINRGTITPYYNATIKATTWIQPGMELFAHYGATEDSTDVSIYHDTVTRWDYEKADKLLDRMLNYFDQHGAKMSDSLKDDVIDFMLDTVLEGADGKHAKILRSLLPPHLKKLRRVKEAGGTFAYRNRDIIKSQDWLKEHGLCVDNLVVEKSTIPDAGRGAFARRAIKSGDVISPVPMLPVLNEEVFEQYTITKEEIDAKNKSKVVFDENAASTGYHLLYNYAYGHPESTLMLIPLAPMVNYVNHANDPSQVNAHLQWAKHEDLYNDHALHDLDIERIRTKNTRRVTMELVALKDINVGDEILINYGDDWAAAYAEYKQQWNVLHPNSNNEKYPMKALELRSLYVNKPYPVNIQEGQTPYPDGVITGCYIESVDDFPDGHIRRNEFNQQVVQWLGPQTRSDYMGQHLTICDLIDRIEYVDEHGVTKFNYTVHTRKEVDPTSKTTILEVHNVPHSAITFVDRPYTSDIHSPNAFRRWINIDDQRFPQAWRNARV